MCRNIHPILKKNEGKKEKRKLNIYYLYFLNNQGWNVGNFQL